jgi:hypothetical protein
MVKKNRWLRHLHDIRGFRPKNQCCPLCLKVFQRGYNIELHLARHLEKLAVMSIPSSKLSGNTDLLRTFRGVKPTQTARSDTTQCSRFHSHQDAFDQTLYYRHCDLDTFASLARTAKSDVAECSKLNP